MTNNEAITEFKLTMDGLISICDRADSCEAAAGYFRTFLYGYIHTLDGLSLRESIDKTLPDMRAELLHTMPSEHCQHEYDCCGHWYRKSVNVYTNPTGFFVIVISYEQNI